jgi:hypothetical protein
LNFDLFAYHGKIKNRNFGHIITHCTQLKNLVLIEKTDGTKFVISPDEPEEFLATAKHYLG